VGTKIAMPSRDNITQCSHCAGCGLPLKKKLLLSTGLLFSTCITLCRCGFASAYLPPGVFLCLLYLGQGVVLVTRSVTVDGKEQQQQQQNQWCGISEKSKLFSCIFIFTCTLTKSDFRWKYAIDSVLEVHIRRYTQPWSWSNIKNHRQLLKSYKMAYKTKLTQAKVSEEIQKQIQVWFACVTTANFSSPFNILSLTL
jgi:hypothetical protein